MWKFLKKLFCMIFRCRKPDIEIRICLNNSEPTEARLDCLDTEIRKYPEGTVLPICQMDHNKYVFVDTCMDSGNLVDIYCPVDRIEFQKRYIEGTEPSVFCLAICDNPLLLVSSYALYSPG